MPFAFFFSFSIFFSIELLSRIASLKTWSAVQRTKGCRLPIGNRTETEETRETERKKERERESGAVSRNIISRSDRKIIAASAVGLTVGDWNFSPPSGFPRAIAAHHRPFVQRIYFLSGYFHVYYPLNIDVSRLHFSLFLFLPTGKENFNARSIN